MNYIIDPSVFYWINVMSLIQTICGITGGFILAAALACLIGCIYNTCEIEVGKRTERIDYYKENIGYLAAFKKWLIITSIVGSILVLASVFIPGKSTSIEMLVANTATFDTVNWTVQQVKEAVDYIVSAISALK